MSAPLAENQGRGEKVGRAGRSPGQLWQVPMFFVGLALFILTYITAPSRGDHTASDFQAELTRLRQGLVSGAEKPEVLVAQAENALAKLPQFHRKAAEIQFLAGSAYGRLADQCPPDQLAGNRKKAIAHLEEALALGVAAADQAPLRFRLGWLLYKQGKNQKRALELMAQSVEQGSDQPARGYGILVQAYLDLPKPNLDAALAANQKQLELTDDRAGADIAKARLMRGQLLLRTDQRLEALKELERIGRDAPQAIRIQARLLQAGVCADEGLWNRAVPVWKELLKDSAALAGGKARALYALGVACKNSTPPQFEEAVTQWEAAFALGGDDGQAAGIRLGEMKLLYGNKADAPEALAFWSKALANIHTPNDYKIKALELKRAREILESACIFFLDGHDYEKTRQVAEIYKRIAPPGAAEERIAQAAEGLARAAQESAARLGAADDSEPMREVRAQFHRAALAYEEAAVARDTESPEIDWRSAQCYLAAQDYARAGAALGKFVGLEKNETRLAEGYLDLAEVYVKLGNKESARKFYYKCIEYPSTPFVGRARYQLAVEEMENKNYDKAKDILNNTLIHQGPIQDRAAYEQSIYKMAELTYLTRDFVKAAVYFKQAIEQYPNHAGIGAARAQFGDCYVQLAKAAQQKMLDAKDQAAKVHHQKERQNWLQQAADVYDNLADELEHNARQNPLTLKELGLLRDARFTAAAIKYDMNDFPEAVRRYVDLQEKYRRKAAGLIACQRIWRCVEFITEPSQARQVIAAVTEAIAKCKVDLAAMPEDSNEFRGPGVFTKTDWENWIRQTEAQLNRAAQPRRPNPAID